MLLTQRRIMHPILPPTVLHREALVMHLQEALGGPGLATPDSFLRHKLLLLCAPAGYGKTTLLADFVQHTALSSCWVMLEQTETETMPFLELLIASMCERFPQLSHPLNALLARASASYTHNPRDHHPGEAVIDALVNAITTEIPERFALILCNYHEVNLHASVTRLVNRFLRQIPSHCLLVVESRAVPLLEFTPLVARREMLGLGSNDLRFKMQEVAALAQLQGIHSFTEEDARTLTASFDGWIAGILLGTRLGNVQLLSEHASSSWGTPALHMQRQHLLAYIMQEVFAHNPQAYTFLKETSILRQMTPQLCADLLDIPEAAMRLSQLEQQGCFVSHAGEEPEIQYRCQPLLRALLCEELHRQDPQRFTLLHRRAAHMFHLLHDDDQAIFHALEASAHDLAASLILEAGPSLLAQGRLETLARWIDALPQPTLEHSPLLLLARAEIYLLLGEHTPALPLLEHAARSLEERPPQADPIARARLLVARGAACFQAGDYPQAQRWSQQALALLPVDEVELRVKASIRLGVCANLLGSVSAGISHLQYALHLSQERTTVPQTAQLHTLLANTYDMLSNYALSEHHHARALDLWGRFQNEIGKVNSLTGMGVTKQRQGAFAEAEEAFQQALALSRGSLAFQRGEAYALVSLGDLYLDQGMYQQALAQLEEGLLLARRLKDHYLIEYTQCSVAMAYLLLGDAPTALVLVNAEPQMQAPNYEWAIRQLARGTILLHEQRAKEALTCLNLAETFFQSAGIKREQIQTTIRRAACFLAQGNTSRLLRTLEKADALITQSGSQLLARLEVQRLPALLHALQHMPETTPARKWLQPEDTSKRETASYQQKTSVSTSLRERTSRLQVLALGEPQVLIDEMPITRWRMARALELYFLLLERGGSLRKEQMIVALWPDADDELDKKLRAIMYYIRQAIGEACLIRRGGVYTLNHAAVYGEIAYDVTTFFEHHATAKQAQEAGDSAIARTAYQQMVDLYRGDYVQSFYSDWCIPRRDELRQAYMNARQQLARLAWKDEAFDESAIHWQHMLAVDPAWEKAHHGLIRCYIQQGKRDLALRQYHRCVTTLHEELAATPGLAIQRLYQQLVEQGGQ